jgi:diaminopimelate decarboxylase
MSEAKRIYLEDTVIIYISGLYSGGNPQPGVGIARSLRQGFPEATLMGVEYSNRISGIHWHEFDDIWLQRSWAELDLDEHGRAIRRALDGGALWISGSDLETLWLSDVFPGGHPNLLTPNAKALTRTTKPEVEAHEGLPVQIPPYLPAERSDWDLHAFCRKHDWRVWLKGPYYEAVRARTWDGFEALRQSLSKAWDTDRLFLQAHVSGHEESVMFSAYRGELLEAVRMRKREVTEEGKTWAGDVTDVEEAFLAPLREIVRNLGWTGGGELEMVRDARRELWMLEWNPRFPAWVHGATIAGFNLPALLVSAATGQVPRPVVEPVGEFTRVVLEVPVRAKYPLPALPEPFAGGVGHSLKHPAGLPALAERLHRRERGEDDTPASASGDAPEVPASFVADLNSQNFDTISTPAWVFMDRTASDTFERAEAMASGLSTSATRVTNAYSIKTNPDPRLLRLARNSGFLAEAISLLEVKGALDAGFRPEQVILNGPGKWWPEGLLPTERLHAVFSDSTSDLQRVLTAVEDGRLSANVIGVRLRVPQMGSRFGIPLDSPKAFSSLVSCVSRMPTDTDFGIHFHMASSNIGVGRWWRLFDSMLAWCQSIERLTGRGITVLDVGGGWFPDDWHSFENSTFAAAVKRARAALPELREIISEPGKAIAQPSMALAMRVLETQEEDGEITEAVVDGSIAELPMYFHFPHRVMTRTGGAWEPLLRGRSHLMGRLCMEHDVVAANVKLPEGTRAGDLLVFCDAGGYDRSMSYVFGRG